MNFEMTFKQLVLKSVALAIFSFVTLPAFGEATGVVHVSSNEQGQGRLISRGGECFLIAPNHVLGSRHDATAISSLARNFQATLIRKYASDIAVLRLESMPDECMQRSAVDFTHSQAITYQGAARLIQRTETGSIAQHSIEIIGYDERYLAISSPLGIKKSQSGSSVQIEGMLVGILVSVDSQTGVGRALRADYLAQLLRSFFPLQRTPDQLCSEAESVIDLRSSESVNNDHISSRLRCISFVLRKRPDSSMSAWIEWHDLREGTAPRTHRFGLFTNDRAGNLELGDVPADVQAAREAYRLTVILNRVNWSLVNTTRLGWALRARWTKSAGVAEARKLFLDVALNAGVAESEGFLHILDEFSEI